MIFLFICLFYGNVCDVAADKVFKKHIAVYGSSDLLITHANRIANEYNIVITEWWKHSEVSKIKETNPKIKILFYRDLIGLRTDYDDWSIANQHATWFVRDTKTGRRIKHKRFNWYLMDTTNEDFKNHLVKYIEMKLQKYPMFDGVFLDDTVKLIDPSKFYIEGSGKNNMPHLDLDFVSGYYHSILEFLKELKKRLGHNLVYINTNDMNDFIAPVDGVMFEGFVHGSWQERNYYPNMDGWKRQILRLQKLIMTSKNILVHSGSRGHHIETYKPFLFSFASYLLCSNDKSSFFFETSQSKNKLPTLDEYNLYIGEPCGGLLFNKDEGLFRRQFDNGMVLVNPTQNTLKATFAEGFNIQESPVGQVLVPSHSGMILIKKRR
jgi:hypothetical protein